MVNQSGVARHLLKLASNLLQEQALQMIRVCTIKIFFFNFSTPFFAEFPSFLYHNFIRTLPQIQLQRQTNGQSIGMMISIHMIRQSSQQKQEIQIVQMKLNQINGNFLYIGEDLQKVQSVILLLLTILLPLLIALQLQLLLLPSLPLLLLLLINLVTRELFLLLTALFDPEIHQNINQV